jgi:hypothetical protein
MSERLLRGARAESATTGARDTKSRRHSGLEMPSGYLALNCRTQSNLSTLGCWGKAGCLRGGQGGESLSLVSGWAPGVLVDNKLVAEIW